MSAGRRVSWETNKLPWTAHITCVDIELARVYRVCRQCFAQLEGRQTAYCSEACAQQFDRNHFWTQARGQALRLSRALHQGKALCAKCGAYGDEVNHIVPLVGANRSANCLNHQTNLELLCRECHQVVTNHQRENRRVASLAATA